MKNEKKYTADIENFTSTQSLINAVARTMNIINAEVEDHHEQVAYLSFFIAKEMGLSDDELSLCIYAALLHDIGVILTDDPGPIYEIEKVAGRVAKAGAYVLSDLEGYEEIARVISISQDSWYKIENDDSQPENYRRIAAIIHLADRVSLVFDNKKPILNQVGNVRHLIECDTYGEFLPEACTALLNISDREFMWLDLELNPQFLKYFTGHMQTVSLNEAALLAKIMSRMIDFRSAFTAMHSAGVAASASVLATLSGMSPVECQMMNIAGLVHDIGKLKINRKILEKPGKLTEAEYNIIKEHPYYTSLILMDVDGFEKIREWAGFHHEKLNGKGYPFHFSGSDLDTGSRILAIADIFSALTEERPYRTGISRQEALKILYQSEKAGELSGDIISLLSENYSMVNDARDQASREIGQRYFDSLNSMRQP